MLNEPLLKCFCAEPIVRGDSGAKLFPRAARAASRLAPFQRRARALWGSVPQPWCVCESGCPAVQAIVQWPWSPLAGPVSGIRKKATPATLGRETRESSCQSRALQQPFSASVVDSIPMISTPCRFLSQTGKPPRFWSSTGFKRVQGRKWQSSRAGRPVSGAFRLVRFPGASKCPSMSNGVLRLVPITRG